VIALVLLNNPQSGIRMLRNSITVLHLLSNRPLLILVVTENFISNRSEIPNHFSTYSHNIHYKTKLFRHPTLKQYANKN